MKSILMIFSFLFMSLSVQSWQTKTIKKDYPVLPMKKDTGIKLSCLTQEAIDRVEVKVKKLEKAKKKK